MFKGEGKQDAAVWSGIKTGALTVLTATVLMIPASYLIYAGFVRQEKSQILAWLCILIGGAFSAAAIHKKRGGEPKGLYLITSAASTAVILILLTLAMPGKTSRFDGLILSIVAGAAGCLAATSVKINKKYRRRGRHTSKYNK